VDTNGRRESQHVDTKGGNNNFIINCENQNSNSIPWALIPCKASCTSQCNQKSELMERASTITYTLQHSPPPSSALAPRFLLRCHFSLCFCLFTIISPAPATFACAHALNTDIVSVST
jgi:hypothetical protein